MSDATPQSRPLGARDALVFRRVSRTRWTHLGGLGRGASWAGTIELKGSPTGGPGSGTLELDAALAGPLRRHGSEPHHVVGPYWAATSVVVRVDHDHAVVLGDGEQVPSLHEAADAQLNEIAALVARSVTGVSPTKFLADEVEVLTALSDLTAAATSSLPEVMHHVARTVADALGCELAVLWLPTGRYVAVQHGWSVPGDAGDLAAVPRGLVERLDEADPSTWLVVQDARQDPLPPPLRPVDGVVAYFALPLALRAGRGVLLLVHTVASARGFTDLCQRLARQLAASGSPLIDAALHREDLERQLDSSRVHASSDPLTGALNRRGWDEALEATREVVALGQPATVVTVDLDGLKIVNDTAGHAAGDELIVAAAHALRQCVRDERDVVARVGGDEFAIVLPGVGTAPAVIAARLRHSLEAVVTAGGLQLRTSIGAATCPPYGSLADAVHLADCAMYDDKRSRRQPV